MQIILYLIDYIIFKNINCLNNLILEFYLKYKNTQIHNIVNTLYFSIPYI
jgi:hypothetical protein